MIVSYETMSNQLAEGATSTNRACRRRGSGLPGEGVRCVDMPCANHNGLRIALRPSAQDPNCTAENPDPAPYARLAKPTNTSGSSSLWARGLRWGATSTRNRLHIWRQRASTPGASARQSMANSLETQRVQPSCQPGSQEIGATCFASTTGVHPLIRVLSTPRQIGVLPECVDGYGCYSCDELPPWTSKGCKMRSPILTGSALALAVLALGSRGAAACDWEDCDACGGYGYVGYGYYAAPAYYGYHARPAYAYVPAVYYAPPAYAYYAPASTRRPLPTTRLQPTAIRANAPDPTTAGEAVTSRPPAMAGTKAPSPPPFPRREACMCVGRQPRPTNDESAQPKPQHSGCRRRCSQSPQPELRRAGGPVELGALPRKELMAMTKEQP